jgi:quinohemoprotein ethanol dehydrogenase
MKKLALIRWIIPTACAALTVWVVLAQQPRLVDSNTLKNAAKNGDEWLTYGRDYSETRFSPLKLIDSTNVQRLGLNKVWPTRALGAIETTPLVHDGIMYGTLSYGAVFAFDLRTGERIWEWDPQVTFEKQQRACCGVVNRGVAMYQGRIYVGVLDGRLAALDAKTGHVDWQVQTTPPDEWYTITGAPRVIKGKVMIGNGGAEYAVRGFLSAYDAATGKLDWRFYTVPGDPSKPFGKIPHWPRPRKRGPASGGRWAAAAHPGTPWLTIQRPI